MTAKLDGTNGLLQQYDYQTPTTGFSYTFAAGTTVLVMNPAGTLATGTITMPAAPADGMTITFSSTQIITALTVSANTGQSIVGQPTTLSANGGAAFVYRLANTTWYAQSSVAASSTGVPVLNVYTSTTPGQTYTKPATVKAIKVTVVGGGGGGARGATGSGGGGGGGGTSINIYPAPSLPASAIPYTVGAAGTAGAAGGPGTGGTGGTSSFGSAPLTVTSATGGSGAVNSSIGGAGGSGSGGTLNTTGGGGSGAGTGTNSSGIGGSSSLGGGAYGVVAPSVGATGGNYGGGGSGGSVTPGNIAGGAGAQGVIIVEEFY